MGEDKKVKKVGMKDIQREGWEYELTVSFNLDRDTHTATASKDRTEMFDGIDPFVITEETGVMIADWCNKGVDVKQAVADAIEQVNGLQYKEEVLALREMLPLEVLNNVEFKTAANIKYKQLTINE